MVQGSLLHCVKNSTRIEELKIVNENSEKIVIFFINARMVKCCLDCLFRIVTKS
jgi:hypothetical protein